MYIEIDQRFLRIENISGNSTSGGRGLWLIDPQNSKVEMTRFNPMPGFLEEMDPA
jgi:hypothetical protein